MPEGMEGRTDIVPGPQEIMTMAADWKNYLEEDEPVTVHRYPITVAGYEEYTLCIQEPDSKLPVDEQFYLESLEKKDSWYAMGFIRDKAYTLEKGGKGSLIPLSEIRDHALDMLFGPWDDGEMFIDQVICGMEKMERALQNGEETPVDMYDALINVINSGVDLSNMPADMFLECVLDEYDEIHGEDEDYDDAECDGDCENCEFAPDQPIQKSLS